MSEVRLVIREAGHDWSGTIHGSSADRAIASLGADPTTLTELAAAFARFEKPAPNRRCFANLSAGLRDEPHDAGIVVIDLVARLVVVDSTYSSPGPAGEACYHDGQGATDTWLRYHLAEDWLFSRDHHSWQSVAEKRRRERAGHPVVDVRKVFYGRPLLEFLARGTFVARVQRTASTATVKEESPGRSRTTHDIVSARASAETTACGRTDDEFAYDTLKEIHADWLLTPRGELGGVCPRDVAMEWHDHLTWDLQDQAERCSLLGECPLGLEETSFAFRQGGFGTHELVLYYNLVRELLWSCWNRLGQLKQTRPISEGPESLTVGDFLTSEIPRLEGVRDEWLDAPDLEIHGRTPRSIIYRERARLPEGMSGHDAIIDSDCPCCQMAADMPGPMFWHLDGSEMDDDFAFDLRHRTREEWEAEQRQWEERQQRFDAESRERQPLGVTGCGESGEKSVWSSSFSAEDDASAPLVLRLLGLGAHLAELIDDLRGDFNGASATPNATQFIDQLNRDFGNLRELLQNSQPSLAAALVHPVIDRFAVSLAAAASVRPDLAPKCESMTSRLAKFLEPDRSESTGDFGDSELPF